MPIFGKLAQAPMKRPAASVDSLPVVDVGFLSMTQLAKHEAAIREWLLAEPSMGRKRLCTMMLSEKSCHVKRTTAQSYLIRLRREPETPSRKRRRPIKGSCVIPEAPAGVETTYLDLAALSAYDADIREWLSIEPNMGKNRLASKLFEKTGLRANLMAAQNYLIRLRKHPGGGSRPYVKKRPAAASVASAADVDIVWEDAASLRAYDVEARQWFEADPTMFKTGLQRKFLAMKGLHLKLSVAESYLKRLRVAAGQPSSPRALRNRLAGVDMHADLVL